MPQTVKGPSATLSRRTSLENNNTSLHSMQKIPTTSALGANAANTSSGSGSTTKQMMKNNLRVNNLYY